MADLQEILSSISDEDMAKLKSMADSLMGGGITPKQAEKKSTQALPFDENMMGKLMSVMGRLNKEDSRTRLILDLKPLLKDERKQKADEAIKFLQLMDVLPLLKGMFGNE